ncbi:MAG TPA: hypothetical protein VGW36_03445, partial [Pyrinomonadaceae bacterium]|nr:hypothetical protein [Pyrinomonadaceae bacterium]
MTKVLKQLQLRLAGLPGWLRDFLIFFAFLAFTALMTWPWVTRLRDAVADTGDSYSFAWQLWWNFHQTFTDPLNLFHANIFFPYRYTLAFTEHGYGVSLLFFPLFAAGLRPLTVYSIATLIAFAFSGYGAFRLARTLTGSYGAAFVSGIVFAFVPYHFLFLTALPYLFTGWIPLLLEALVLFVQLRTWRRAAWLGFVFLMNGLTCTNWFLLSLVPFLLSAALLLIRYGIVRDKAFWIRGLVGLAIAMVLLLPFMWPYYSAAKIYGFKRDAEEVTRNSAGWVDWVTAPSYNRVWDGMGRNLPDVKATLFTGLLPFLLMLAAVFIRSQNMSGRMDRSETVDDEVKRQRIPLNVLDALCVAAVCWAIVAAGFAGTPPATALGTLLRAVSSDRALMILTIALIARLGISYPVFLRRRLENPNLIESLRSTKRSDAFW